MIRSIIDGLLLAFSYFTILPTFKQHLKIDNHTYASMLFFTPFCGLILSVLSIYILFGLNTLYAPLYAIIISAIVYLILYGFLHLEAICDVIDAWMAKYSKKDIYEIMKEPQVGAIGAIGAFCFILLKLSAIIYLFLDEKFFIFVCIVILSRLSIIYNLKCFAFHVHSSFALSLKQNSSWPLIITAVVFYGVCCMYLINIQSVMILFLISVLCSVGILYILKKRFGFLNGDCIGFSIEITELVLLNVGLLL